MRTHLSARGPDKHTEDPNMVYSIWYYRVYGIQYMVYKDIYGSYYVSCNVLKVWKEPQEQLWAAEEFNL